MTILKRKTLRIFRILSRACIQRTFPVSLEPCYEIWRRQSRGKWVGQLPL